MKTPVIPYKLLAKYLAKECSSTEKESVLNWLNSSKQNKEIFEELQQHWKFIFPAHIVIPEKEKIWKNIQSVVKQQQTSRTYSFTYLRRFAGIVALIAIIITLSITIFLQNYNPQPSQEVIIISPSGQKTQMFLPDGTTVWINSGSKIIYNTDFNIKNRNIKLTGEAFFDVSETQKYPFIVNTENINIKVLGTKFNVKAFVEDDNISISLIEGRIDVLSVEDNRLITNLKPKETGEILKKDLSYTILNDNAETVSVWHLNQLYFENIPANEMWKKLEGWYGVKIKLINSLSKDSTTYRYVINNESLSEVLDLINKLTPITYTINGEEVIIKYNN